MENKIPCVALPEQVQHELRLIHEKRQKEKEDTERARLEAEQKADLQVAAMAAWNKALIKLQVNDLVLKQLKPKVWVIRKIELLDMKLEKNPKKQGETIFKGLIKFYDEPTESSRTFDGYNSWTDDLLFVPTMGSVEESLLLLRNLFGLLIVDKESGTQNTESILGKRKKEDNL